MLVIVKGEWMRRTHLFNIFIVVGEACCRKKASTYIWRELCINVRAQMV